MTPPLRIGRQAVGPGQPCFVIAEAGVNHNGDLAIGRELVRQARAAGADAVKFQTFRADQVATRSAPKAAYQLENTDPAQSQVQMLRALELDEAAHVELMAACATEGIQFLSTPYGLDDIAMLHRLGVAAYKIASGQIVEPYFLEAIARTGLPALLSTGMATLAEVRDAVAVFRANGDPPLVVLQCTTNYPSPVADANLRAMLTMRDDLGVTVGYSDHTVGDAAALAAVALGATVIEKHFTLDRGMPGPDHSSSVEPAELAALVRGIRDVEGSLGSVDKAPTAGELRNRDGMRRSLVAATDLPAGTVLTVAHVAVKRPGTGIPPRELARVVGHRTMTPLHADELLTWDRLAP